MTNKAKQVRETLGLSITECGKLFVGGKFPYRSWKKLEDTGAWNSGTEKMLDIILILTDAKNGKIKDCYGAIDFVLKHIVGDWPR